MVYGRRPPMRPKKKQQPVIQLTLRSTPPGAIASIDGVKVGRTPAFWEGTGGVPREFTFVLPGYKIARYRFVPITTGFVHGELHKLTASSDAGVGY